MVYLGCFFSNYYKEVDSAVEAINVFKKYVILQPAAILGFAGLAAFVHYNDERRVVPKVTFYVLPLSTHCL